MGRCRAATLAGAVAWFLAPTNALGQDVAPPAIRAGVLSGAAMSLTRAVRYALAETGQDRVRDDAVDRGSAE
jgi:hypothetical protein